MNKDLTQSLVDRQNVLNNPFALNEAKKIFNISQLYFTNQQIADFYEVNIRTIERVIEEHNQELSENGLTVLTGSKLQIFLKTNDNFDTDKNVGNKTRKLTVSSFKAVLNFSMLLKTSERARDVRTRILDITMDMCYHLSVFFEGSPPISPRRKRRVVLMSLYQKYDLKALRRR
ncbi:hypothetical protein [Pseudolactococcus carnosus]|uniref:hypothetical protein n=1 Tax=Pseudolactococcus carnosus TaxID=2749961 RepID=UPI000BC80E31|nr:hypothetical protein [Lactococcus carnosus]SOB48911.1 hypothetical protein LPICM17_680011 [Lactococcus piscium]MCJ1969932.1 hypothetical protein [Lactococcus carnosus]MCJ1974107.1 hypothetical protein [Lactococcus carnosus]MCJ1981927.1 hypothetical protein [Lactococcus carnosus]MCJ1988452.1 hypothetical protein [Lactococcus carnosus]